MDAALSRKAEFARLEAINLEIAEAETAGNASWLDERLALEFGFRKADKSFVSRTAFLANVKQSGKRSTVVDSISIYGDRAIVACIVTMEIDGAIKKFHNLRLFVKSADDWKLLGWANEAL